jgi:hypothetical protein
VRRRGLLLALGALIAGPATAQEAAPAAEAPPRPAPAPRPRRRRRPRQAARPEPPPPETANLAPPTPPASRLEAAPVPNRDLEAPRVIRPEGPSFAPDVIQRRLPGRGQAAEGVPDRTEERLFAPAPGARLNLPFSY